MAPPVAQWYAPFLQSSVEHFTIDPWRSWISGNGDPIAFPYGYAMWIILLPGAWISHLLEIPTVIGYGATLACVDFAMLCLLHRTVSASDRLLLSVYWLSPIVIVATYVLGYNDIIPVFGLVYGLQAMQTRRPFWAGVACAIAVSAKLAMVIALPFFAIYLLHNRPLRDRKYLRSYLAGLAAASLALLAPYLLSSFDGVRMVLANPESAKIYRVAITFGLDAAPAYIVPMVYLLMIYGTWRVKRLNFELFQTMFGMAFLSVVLLTPASPGWMIWGIPLLVVYQARSDSVAIMLVAVFSALYTIGTLPLWPDVERLIRDGTSVAFDVAVLNGKWAALVHTATIGIGLTLLIRIWRETVTRNDFFRLSRRPFVVGVAGDSGAGKDTFSAALTGLFGRHSVTTVSGDDYHLWDRHKPMWQVMTHLNPMANDLEGFANDLVTLIDGKPIHARHYDHATGRMSRPGKIRSNDIIIASGLHSLYLSMLRECYNLGIYLDIDEGLRRFFKIRRDVDERGHTLEKVLQSFERRESDSERFIRPQSKHADLVLSLQPIHPRMLCDSTDASTLRFRLVARSRHGLNELLLMRVLIGVCGLHVDMTSNAGTDEIELSMEGETSAEDIELAAKMVCPRIFEFLDLEPQWQDGVMGLMQLVTLSHINQALTKRFIW